MTSRIVLCDGCFDPLHWGHLKHFEAARSYGSWLVVSVTRDAFVKKGPGRPVFNENQRAEMVGALSIVDRVILSENSLDALDRIRPKVFVKGQDYIGKIEEEHYEFCKKHDIEIVFTREPKYSSTDLLSHYGRKPA